MWKQGQATQVCTKHRNWYTEKWQDILWKHLKQLVVAEGSLFVKWQESSAVMSVCRQQWNMLELPSMFWAANLQMELKVWSGSMMISMLKKNTGKYFTIIQYHTSKWQSVKITNGLQKFLIPLRPLLLRQRNLWKRYCIFPGAAKITLVVLF